MIGISSMRALRSENFAGSVWLSAGAPGTTSLPLTKISVSEATACELGSSVPACAGFALSFGRPAARARC